VLLLSSSLSQLFPSVVQSGEGKRESDESKKQEESPGRSQIPSLAFFLAAAAGVDQVIWLSRSYPRIQEEKKDGVVGIIIFYSLAGIRKKSSLSLFFLASYCCVVRFVRGIVLGPSKNQTTGAFDQVP
jgi:hypothetical protein